MPVVWVVLAYLLGTFPSAVLVARANGIDIHTFGSGNPGASNVTRALGWRKGAWVFALDALKGAIPAAVGLAVDGRPLAYAMGIAAVLGHVYPITRRFRGGKGVATGAGVLIVLFPLIFLVAAPTWLVVAKLTHKPVVASIAAIAVVLVGMAMSDLPWWEYLGALCVCALIAARHIPNVKRLLRREEHSITLR